MAGSITIMAADWYASADELMKFEQEGRDYRIHIRKGRTQIAIVAPHGGRIEPGTMAIADAIAGNEHGFYGFESIKPRKNVRLHITASRFQERRLETLVGTSRTVLTVHGCRGSEPVVFVGGRDLDLRQCLIEALTSSGFDARQSNLPGLRGNHPDNICNRGGRGKGIQFELSEGLRTRMLGSLDRGGVRRKTALFDLFVTTVRESLDASTIVARVSM
jgi:phage replication-related protein YjqB (UPF0714/DUF867 family)